MEESNDKMYYIFFQLIFPNIIKKNYATEIDSNMKDSALRGMRRIAHSKKRALSFYNIR